MGLFHITSQPAWAQARAAGEYRAPSLEQDGFIHLSSDRQWLVAGHRFYRQQTDLVLLSVRKDALKAEVRLEEADGDRYPHLYGPLNVDAVVEVHPLTLDERGLFAVPHGLSPWRAMFLPAAHRIPVAPEVEGLLKQTEPRLATVLQCIVPEHGELTPMLCLEAAPGHAGQLSLKAVAEAIGSAVHDLLVRHSGLLQLGEFPRRADGAVDDAALLSMVERMLEED